MKKLKIFIMMIICTSMALSGCGSKGVDKAQTSEPTSKALEEYIQDGIFGIDTTREYKDTQALEVDQDSDFTIQKQVLTPDNGRIQHKGVSLEIDAVFMSEEDNITMEVTKMKAPKPLENAVVSAYKFTASNSNYDGLYTITIPYDTTEGIVGAGYFNKSSNKWEPVVYEIDEANKQVIITTDHLSTYGAFTITNEGTRYARISSGLFEAHNHMSRQGSMHGEIIQEALGNEMTPGQKAVDLGSSIVGDWFTATGVIMEFEGLAYSSEYLSDLSDIFGNIGLALSIAQLASDYSRGDQQAMAINTFNTAQGLAIGKWGTKALKVSMIGVTAIDYSLNKLIEQVIGGREEVWFKAYDRYYNDRQKRTGQDWYHRIKQLHDHASTPERFQALLETELNMYTYLFWQEDEAVIAEYQSDVMNHAWSGGGGLNQQLKERIAEEYKSNLLRYTLEPVLRRIEKEVRYEQFLEYQEELRKARDELNRVITFEVQEESRGNEELDYAGYIIQLGPLADSADYRQWTGRLNKDGYVQTKFTVLGHLAAGAPNEIRLYETIKDLENENPELTVAFTVDVPNTRVTIGQIEDVDLTGVWEGYSVITDSVFAEQDLSNIQAKEGSSIGTADEFEAFFEGCEDEFGEAIMLMIQDIVKGLMHKDIPTTIEFVKTEQENQYSGYIHIRPEEVTDSAIGDDIRGERAPFKAIYTDGKVSITVDTDDSIMYYFGDLQSEDHITGTFNAPHGEFDIMAGTWRATRVDNE
ncbi:hypothetical protein SAMN05660297_02663 [Natronincola peptidivorans]|uniref:Uncharacterized protein n=1 Tax=Natronincola peptidivorans TaxID=426128 RepID=A0A1I0F3I3_9FIRM|nr:hypothetical protein [Natronincola peptidivorans]SET52369.1 hypothetical protein SAMN05660297_02663 [Natronincola peptidivorans]